MIRSTTSNDTASHPYALPCLMRSLKNGAIYFMYFRNNDCTLCGVCVKESNVVGVGVGYDLRSGDASQFEIYRGVVKLENV